MYTELCLEWPNTKSDKLTRVIHMKQLFVGSMLCFSFDRPVTGNCPILVLKKKCTRLKKYYQRLWAVPTWFQSRCKWFKSILIFKAHSVSGNTHRVQSECLLPESTNHGFLKRLRYHWVDSEKWSVWADTEVVINRVKADQTVGLSAVGNVSGYRCVSDCRSRGREFDPGPVPYFRGDWSWNNFYGHSPPFRWFIQEGLLSVTSESMCANYWLTACSSLSRKKCG